MCHPVVLLLKNGAPAPSLKGLLDVPVALHHLKKAQNYVCEIVLLSFEAQPCVPLADISSLSEYREPSARVPFLAALHSGALLFLEQRRSTKQVCHYLFPYVFLNYSTSEEGFFLSLPLVQFVSS